MGRGKLQKFADMADNPLVVECPYWQLQKDGFTLRGRWRQDFFHNSNPITLELGCGRGEYTVALARQNPGRNYIGVDIKGARMWHGAQTAQAEGLTNVAFLRTNIECIDQLFGSGEVDEIWLTFSDPQMKKATKRLSSTYFLERYRHFMVDGAVIHLKTDSPFLYTYTRLMAQHNALPIEADCDDLYVQPTLPIADIRTYYEQMWLDRGMSIKYLRFRLPQNGVLQEPDVEIPVDGYRSYNHQVVSTRTTAK